MISLSKPKIFQAKQSKIHHKKFLLTIFSIIVFLGIRIEIITIKNSKNPETWYRFMKFLLFFLFT